MELILNSIDFAENRSKDGYSSGGELYFVTDNGFFPAEHWYDCAYLDLKIWIPRLISFGSNHTESCEFSFMDGPYMIQLFRREDGAVFADYFRYHTFFLARQSVDMAVLLKSTLFCCRKYDRFLYENGKTLQFQKEIKTLVKLLDT